MSMRVYKYILTHSFISFFPSTLDEPPESVIHACLISLARKRSFQHTIRFPYIAITSFLPGLVASSSPTVVDYSIKPSFALRTGRIISIILFHLYLRDLPKHHDHQSSIRYPQAGLQPWRKRSVQQRCQRMHPSPSLVALMS